MGPPDPNTCTSRVLEALGIAESTDTGRAYKKTHFDSDSSTLRHGGAGEDRSLFTTILRAFVLRAWVLHAALRHLISLTIWSNCLNTKISLFEVLFHDAALHARKNAAAITTSSCSASKPMNMHPMIASIGEFVKQDALSAATHGADPRAPVTIGAPTPSKVQLCAINNTMAVIPATPGECTHMLMQPARHAKTKKPTQESISRTNI